MGKANGFIYIIVGSLLFLVISLECLTTLPELLDAEATYTARFIAIYAIVLLILYALPVFIILRGVKRFKKERKSFNDQLDEF